MIRTDKRLRLSKWLIVLILCFIWGNSLLPGTDSGNLSGGIMTWINSFLGLGEAGAETLHLLIRKCAHFTEFACLGALLCWRFGMLGKNKAVAFGCGALAACIDETIQVFVPDRGPALKDVCIDSAGVLTGIILLWVGYDYFKKRSTHKSLEDK